MASKTKKTPKKTAKKTAKKRGRKPDASSKSGQIRDLLKTDMSVADIAKQVGCTPALVYNVKARLAGGSKRGPGRPPKASGRARAGAAADGLAGILEAVQSNEKERRQMRAALERIQSVVQSVLG